MKKKNKLHNHKKFMAGVLAIAMTTVSFLTVPKSVDAAVAEDKVVYEQYTDVASYREDGYKAPIKEGYVFGGWYADDQGNAYYDEDGANDQTTAYAKFVPAQVLSVKAQNKQGTTDATDSTYVRILSSLDSTKYQKVGFDIRLANKKQVLQEDGSPLETEKVYNGVTVGTGRLDVKQVFGGASEYISAWELKDVEKINYSKIIYVRPYWITMDGTKVEGLAKYVHIEDGYNEYISVPVNLMTGKEVAAGAVNVSYPEGAELVDVEAGRLLPEMRSTNDTATNTIKLVGKSSDISDVKADGIYANFRFKKSSLSTTEATVFNVTESEFCNNAEELLPSVKAWDSVYTPITQTP